MTTIHVVKGNRERERETRAGVGLICVCAQKMRPKQLEERCAVNLLLEAMWNNKATSDET